MNNLKVGKIKFGALFTYADGTQDVIEFKPTMKQTVHFSKTERLPDGNWLCTIAPKSHRNEGGRTWSRPRLNEVLEYKEEFVGKVIAKNSKKFPNEITFHAFKGFPCVGIGYDFDWWNTKESAQEFHRTVASVLWGIL